MTQTAPSATPWPELPYDAFAPTMHLLHMGLQMVGKLTLLKPFEPQWANVALGLTSTGLTTGPVPWRGGSFTVDADFRDHEVVVSTSWGAREGFALEPMPVAGWHDRFFAALSATGVTATINERPQEVPDPVPFPHDTAPRPYDRGLVEAWFRILHGSAAVMQRYRSCFSAKTPPVGFMWGTFDLRDIRLGGTAVEPSGANAAFIRRNAMNEDQVECGWWPGSPSYPRSAFYSFTYPQPAGIETAKPRPAAARWDAEMGEFLLDYDDMRATDDPDIALLDFLDSTYEAGATKAGWDPAWICSGQPDPVPEGETP